MRIRWQRVSGHRLAGHLTQNAMAPVSHTPTTFLRRGSAGEDLRLHAETGTLWDVEQARKALPTITSVPAESVLVNLTHQQPVTSKSSPSQPVRSRTSRPFYSGYAKPLPLALHLQPECGQGGRCGAHSSSFTGASLPIRPWTSLLLFIRSLRFKGRWDLYASRRPHWPP